MPVSDWKRLDPILTRMVRRKARIVEMIAVTGLARQTILNRLKYLGLYEGKRDPAPNDARPWDSASLHALRQMADANLPLPEIAAKLGRSSQAVKNRLFRLQETDRRPRRGCGR